MDLRTILRILNDARDNRRIRYRRGLEIVGKAGDLRILLIIEVHEDEHARVTGMVAGEDVLEDLAVCVSHMIAVQDVENSSESRDRHASGWRLPHLGALDSQAYGSRDVHELGVLTVQCIP